MDADGWKEESFPKLTHRMEESDIEAEANQVTNQKAIGTCWISACLSVIRVPFIKKYELEDFEFSQSYIFFWDKVERSYYFLMQVVQTARRKEPVDDRLVSYLLSTPMNDGSQWDVIVNLIKKYGLMPKRNFTESVSLEASAQLNSILKSKVREFAIILRKMVEDGNSDADIKNTVYENMMIVFDIVGKYSGIPNSTFTWEYLDKSEQYQSKEPITPLDFYKEYVKPVFNVDDEVCLVTDPRPSNKYNQAYTVDCLGNVRKFIDNNQLVELFAQLCACSKNDIDDWVVKEECGHLEEEEYRKKMLKIEAEKGRKERIEAYKEEYMHELARECALVEKTGGSLEDFINKILFASVD